MVPNDGDDDDVPQEDEMIENFRITEINARFSFNGFMHECYGQQALDGLGLEERGLMSATDGEKVRRPPINFLLPHVLINITPLLGIRRPSRHV